MTKRDARIFDICYFLLGQLLEHEDNAEDVTCWYEIYASFLEGYENTEPFISREYDVVFYMMECIEILFVAYFIKEKQVDFAEGAAKLYHFLRENRADR